MLRRACGCEEQESDLLFYMAAIEPMKVEGQNAAHVIAFAREYRGKVLLTIAERWFASLLPEPTALEGVKESLQQTFIEIPTAIAGAAKPMKFTNVLTGATVPAEELNGGMRLSAGDSLGTLPARCGLSAIGRWIRQSEPVQECSILEQAALRPTSSHFRTLRKVPSQVGIRPSAWRL